MKSLSLRIMLMLTLCGAMPTAHAMWGRLGKAALSRISASRAAVLKKANTVLNRPVAAQLASPFKSGFMTSRNKRLLAGFSLFGGTTTAVAAAKVYKHQCHSTQTYPFKQNGTLTINDFAGDINVQGWDKEELEVKVSREADDWTVTNNTKIDSVLVSPSEHRIDALVKGVAGNWYTRANHPGIVFHCNGETFIHNGGSITVGSTVQHNGTPMAKVGYNVRAPHNTNVIIKSIAGSMVLNGIAGSINAETRSGTIKTEGCSNIQAKSASGDVNLTASYGNVTGKSVSGNVVISALFDKFPVLRDWRAFGIKEAGVDYGLTSATGSSITGNVTISGAEKGQATSTTGKASFNRSIGSHIEFR